MRDIYRLTFHSNIFIISLLSFCTNLAANLAKNEAENVLVRVEEGTLRGEKIMTITEDGYYYSFKGIPYALPPVGNLRFKEPQPPKAWTGERNATEHGSICVQNDIFTNEYLGDEDCLFLNVYSPTLYPEKPLAVMVFIHGGAFKSDSGNVDNYGPDFLVQHEVVLVTLNYRLDALGFLSLESKEVPGNNGLKDQHLVLKWVKNNIKSFGGDPDNITIFGQSAGGASVILHTLSSQSQGLFKRAIAMSGVPLCDWAVTFKPRKRAFALGRDVGIKTKDDKVLLEYLKSVPAKTLVGKSPAVLASENIITNTLRMAYFAPVPEINFGENNVLTNNNNAPKINIMLGYTNEEAILDVASFEDSFLETYSKFDEMLVPIKISYETSPSVVTQLADHIREHYFNGQLIGKDNLRNLLTFLNDSSYIYQIISFARHVAERGLQKLFLYNFSAVTERNIYGKLAAKYNLTTVASHLDDTVYIFNPKRHNLKIQKNSKEYEIIHMICKLFTNFAKYGNPTPDDNIGVIWPEYSIQSPLYMDIGNHLTVQNDTNEVFEFWNPVFTKPSEVVH